MLTTRRVFLFVLEGNHISVLTDKAAINAAKCLAKNLRIRTNPVMHTSRHRQMTKDRERCRACLIFKNAHFEVTGSHHTRKRVAEAARRDCKRCSVGNETAGRSVGHGEHQCCVEWRERREERSVVAEQDDGRCTAKSTAPGTCNSAVR